MWPISREFPSAPLSLEHHAGGLQSNIVFTTLCILGNNWTMKEDQPYSIWHYISVSEVIIVGCISLPQVHFSLKFSLKKLINYNKTQKTLCMERGTVERKEIGEKSLVWAYTIYNAGDLFHFWGKKLQDSNSFTTCELFGCTS